MWEKNTNGFFQTFMPGAEPKLLTGISPVFDLSAFDTADDKRGRAIHIAHTMPSLNLAPKID